MCEMYNQPVIYQNDENSQANSWEEEDKVILETEITLKTGPNITMKLHEESRPNSREDHAILKVLNDDSESDFYENGKSSPRSPRKVRFGGEHVKMRTPETEEDDSASTTIKITVTDAVSIRTRKSQIPVRVSSLPTTPKKGFHQQKKPLGKLYKSTPNLNFGNSKIPLRKQHNFQLESKEEMNETRRNMIKEVKPSILKPRRGDDEALSPVPVHNEIEVFHNLTRSPDRGSKKSSEPPVENKSEASKPEVLPQEVAEMKTESYDSFKVCEQVPTTDKLKTSSLQQSISSLTSDEEVWSKSEALESLVKMMKEPGTCESLEAGPAALLLEALFACHHREKLHTLADDALMVLIDGLRQDILFQCLPRLAVSLCKLGGSSGVRCALVVMKKVPPKKLQAEILWKGFSHRTREGALKILLASARLYPRQDVEVAKIAEFAALALRDRRRKVRHAALETLATTAETSSVHEVIDIVNATIKDFIDYPEVIQIVRTRLSRKQLPSVSLDGIIRYSSPSDKSESDWITANSSKNSKIPASPLSSASTSTASLNYWMQNSRHYQQIIEYIEEETTEDSSRIWTVDGVYANKLKSATGKTSNILRPVYVVQSDFQENNQFGRGHRKYDRGRSFSPPKHFRIPLEPMPIINQDTLKSKGFHKSLSSDQLYIADRFSKREQGSSSRSSSTSTGSSTKSGLWHRSGIPVPISELKIRHSTASVSAVGPLIARRVSPQTTPQSQKIQQDSQISDNAKSQRLSLPATGSPGSDSSGYFTPSPPDAKLPRPPAFIKMDTEERLSSDIEEPLSSSSSSSAHIGGSVKSVSDEYPKDEVDGEGRKFCSVNGNHCLGEIVNDHYSSVESIHLNNEEEKRPESVRSKSKSVIELPNFLPQIISRKNVNSAPLKKDKLIDNNNTIPVDALLSPASDVPSVEYTVEHQEEIVAPHSGSVSKIKLERRFSRNSSRKSLKASPRANNSSSESTSHRPYSKPKDVLQHVLTQMDNPNWETVIVGLQGLIKLLEDNSEIIEYQMHQVSVAVAKQIKNLRSQVARVACNAAGELFSSCKRGLDMEFEEIACSLFQRTADTNRFLRADANAALDLMCENMPIHRVIPVITSRGCTHQNAVVRAASARLLGDIVKRLGADRTMALPKELRDKLLLAGANSLTDGNLEARSQAKSLFKYLTGHSHFQRCLHEAVPQNVLRLITKALNSLKRDT